MNFQIKEILCVHCGTPLDYDIIHMSDGTKVKSLNWVCPKCKRCGIEIKRKGACND